MATLKFSEAVPHNAAAGGNTSAGGAGGPTVREVRLYKMRGETQRRYPMSLLIAPSADHLHISVCGTF